MTDRPDAVIVAVKTVSREHRVDQLARRRRRVRGLWRSEEVAVTTGSRNTRRSHPARAGRRHLHTAPKNAAWNVRFESLGMCAPASLVAESPTLLVVAVEDLVWQLTRDAWLSRRPHRWHRRQYALWRAQSRELDDKRDRLCELADETLLRS